MQSCLLCPKGTKCKGYVLHGFIVRIYNAIRANGGEDELAAITRRMSREDMEVLATYGGQARVTCWSKGCVLAVAHILAHMVEGRTDSDEALRLRIEDMLRTVLRVLSRLPKGIRIDLDALSLDIYNRTVELLNRSGGGSTVPMTTYGQACANVLRSRPTRARESH